MSAKTQERIDVVICTRNREGSIEAAVRGVLANDHPDFRLTIIDQSAMHAIGWALGPVLDTDDRLRYFMTRHTWELRIHGRPKQPHAYRERSSHIKSEMIATLGAGPTRPGAAYRLAELGHDISASPHKVGDADAVIDRTIDGFLASELLTPEQAESKIVGHQILQVPYSNPVPTIGRDDALAAMQPWRAEHGICARGRFGAWRYEIGNTDHSVMMRVELADRLVSGTPETTWALLPGEEARAVIS